MYSKAGNGNTIGVEVIGMASVTAGFLEWKSSRLVMTERLTYLILPQILHGHLPGTHVDPKCGAQINPGGSVHD